MTNQLAPARPRVVGRRILAGLGIGIGAAVVVGALVWGATALLNPPTITSDAFTVGLVALSYASILLGLVIAHGGVKRFLRVAGFTRPTSTDVGFALLGWGSWVVVTGAVYLVWGVATGEALSPLRDLLQHASDVARLPTATPLVLALIAVRILFLSSALEESLFRGLLQPWLRQRLPLWAAIAITTVAFAIIHVYPVNYPAVILFAIIAGLLRARRNSTTTFFMHILTDLSLLVAAILVGLA
ncbi:MAG: Type prenyl endopeptidase Rce1-like [Actinomycetota bacterium]|nr:Type prenyl endopeptidase Rce1-like [Actinomycetota bacterium]